jgi:hypothetical protein
MFNFSLVYDPDTQKYLDYHKDLLKKSEHERLVREAMKAAKSAPKSHPEMNWLPHLIFHLRLLFSSAEQTSQVHS